MPAAARHQIACMAVTASKPGQRCAVQQRRDRRRAVLVGGSGVAAPPAGSGFSCSALRGGIGSARRWWMGGARCKARQASCTAESSWAARSTGLRHDQDRSVLRIKTMEQMQYFVLIVYRIAGRGTAGDDDAEELRFTCALDAANGAGVGAGSGNTGWRSCGGGREQKASTARFKRCTDNASSSPDSSTVAKTTPGRIEDASGISRTAGIVFVVEFYCRVAEG